MVAFCFFPRPPPTFGSVFLKGKHEFNVQRGRLVALQAKCLDVAKLQ